MPIDFTPFFKKYEELLQAADTVFNQIKTRYPQCVKCEITCADCCHAVFDISLIEALYINHKFNQVFEEAEKSKLLEKANQADRIAYKLKKAAYKDLQAGKNEADILEAMAKERIRCPLLNENDQCGLYEYRPITCRFYGIPTAINGKGHTCGKSAFVKGEPYPTVNLDIVHKRLYEISQELTLAMKSKYTQMAEMLVPLSMALITVYDDEYLGIPTAQEGEKKEDGNG